MPQQDTGPEQRNDSSVGLDGVTLSNGTTSAAFGAAPHPNGAANGSFPPGSGPRESASRNGAARPSLETALTGISRQTTWQDGRGAPNSSTLEYFRRIYLSLQSANSLDTIPTIGITSALDGEGKSTIALGISTAMAADLDSPIVLVELNLTRPIVHKSLGIPAQPGLSEYLRGECPLPNALRQITENLFVLPAGDCRNDPARLIRMLTRANLLLRMDNSGAVLVLDLPPVLTASYGVLASSMADAVVMVVRAGQTPEKMVKDAIARLDESTLRGIILNAARPSIPTWLGGYL
ncbi:MAG TPA: CpsD/CapB family tyrosine-protein kinase [Ktedonobacterales bacterium]